MAQKFFDIVKLNDVYYGEITGEQSIIAKGKIGAHDFAIIQPVYQRHDYQAGLSFVSDTTTC